MSETAFRIPEVGEYVRGFGRLIAVEIIPPPPSPPPVTEYVFEEVSAHVEARVRGRVLEEFHSVWEFHGDGTAVIDALDAAKKYVKRNRLTKASDVEVVVVKVAARSRKVPHEGEHVYARGVQRMESVQRWYDRHETSTDVWSSHGAHRPKSASRRTA